MAWLADEVKDQWTREAALRRLYQPMPLQVRWSSTGRPVAAGRDVVLDEPGADWQQLWLQGGADEIVAAFRGLPHRQMVVLGEAGAGKSILAVLLTLGLIREPGPGQPVPVLLPIASWNPKVESAQHFIVRRLGEEYPFLAGRAEDGRTLAEFLVARDKVLPILDGLDELPANLHAQAVELLDQYAAPGRALVVTCRGREYEQAVRSGGLIMSRSAVVEIEPVTIEQAIEFLSHPAPARPRWEPVFDHLREHPDGRLAKALSTPLMVALARAAYRSPVRNPADLLARASSSALTASLIDGFVQSVYGNDRTDPRASERRWSREFGAEDAVRWLSCLAYHLYLAGTRDLWWWQLRPGFLSLRPFRAKLILPVACALIVAAGGLAVDLTVGLWPAIGVAEAALLIVVFNSEGLFRSMWPASYPPHVVQRDRSPTQRRVRYIGARLAFGVLFGVMAGGEVGLLPALAGGVACALVTWVMPDRPAPTGKPGPRMTLQANRRNTLYAAAQYGLAGGVIFAAIALLTKGAHTALSTGCIAALIYALAAAFGAGLWTWTQFKVAHIWLAAHGWLPWRLWAFLDDAHSRGVLRQAGTVWQFRHALLQDHLARNTLLDHLRARADAGDGRAACQLAELLIGQGRMEDAIAILRTSADAGNGHAGYRLAELLARQGRTGEAIAAVQASADASDVGNRLARLLTRQGRTDAVIAILRTRVESGDYGAIYWLADLLAGQGRMDDAIAILQPRVESGDYGAIYRLADLLAGQGRMDETFALLQRCADAGDQNAAYQLAGLLAEHGLVDELRARADAGDQDARHRLAGLLAEHGLVDELRARADAGDQDARHRLAGLLAEHGLVDELRARADAGDQDARHRLAGLLAKQDRIDEAIAILRQGVNTGDWARYQLADLLARQDRVDEAITTLQGSADVGGKYAEDRLAGLLADLLERQGRVDEAIAVLRPHVNADDWDTARHLAGLLERQGRVDEAIAVLRPQANAVKWNKREELADLLARHGRIEELRTRADGDRASAHRLADLLARQGRMDELRARADGGDSASAHRLADLLAEQDHVDEAIAVLRPRADAGDMHSACRMAELLETQGLPDEAIAVLRAPADDGDQEAAGRLAELLAEQGQVDELKARADAGSREAAYQLADLLGKQGQVNEAIAILRPRAEGGDQRAANQLADLLARQDRLDEAIAILQSTADNSNGGARYQLADLLARQGRVDEAVITLRDSAEAGDPYAWYQLAWLLAGHGRLDEAIAALKPSADADVWGAKEQLACLLAWHGQTEEAINVLGDPIDPSCEYTWHRVVEWLIEQGRADKAVAILRDSADVGDQHNSKWLAKLFADAIWRDSGDLSDQSIAKWLAKLWAGQERTRDATQP